MSVATHLGIDLGEYDARIRTFIPHYEEMIEVATSALEPSTRVILDLGIGTGALSQRCLKRVPESQIIGIDADSEVLKAAALRLPSDTKLICQSFVDCPFPACDTVVASFALHHVRTEEEKLGVYSRIAAALSQEGRVLVVDCLPAQDVNLAEAQLRSWNEHLSRHYGEAQAQEYMQAWSKEDVYMPLNTELELLRKAGFATEVLWRKDAFAVIRGTLLRSTAPEL